MIRKRLGILSAVISVFLSMTLLLTSCAPVNRTKLKANDFKSKYSANAGEKYHKVKRNAFDLICKSGLIEMYFDEKTSAVGILDTSADVFWSSLPEENKHSLALSPLEIVLSTKSGEVYTLNSQDSAVCFSNTSFEKNKNGVNVKYSLSVDKASGKTDIKDVSDGTIRADVTVTYTLSDGSFYTSVSMNNISLPKNVFLEKIRLLNSFGAYSDEKSDDFIFVPDGSGAIIKTGIKDSDFKPVSLKVYGDDTSVESGKDSALLGTFGIKHGKGAFLCIIEKGDSIATINATRNGKSTLNSVGAEFDVTDISETKSKNKQTKCIGSKYGGDIKLCYRFLSGKSATYSGMAAACRENLIRNSVISSKAVSAPNASLPLMVNLQFGYYDNDEIFSVKSDFEQAETLMTLLKAKGVNNVYLRANGIFKNANNAVSDDFGKFIKELGGIEKYNSLYSYMKTQNFPIYIDTSLLSSHSGGAENINGKKYKFTYENASLNMPTKKRQHLKMSELERHVENLLYSSSSVQFDGYALNDIGSCLYSDYSSDFYPRESSKREISALIPVLSSNKPIMIETGNFYAIKNASVISSLPQGVLSRKENKAYCSVPFVELLLHGTYEYCIDNINLSKDPEKQFLKTVEYGALPSASWYCAKTDGKDKYGYDNNINDIVSYCEKANDILSDLRDARMTAHQEIQQGVYCTEYNNSTKVYVNYTDKPVTINGITVSAKDCMKIS